MKKWLKVGYLAVSRNHTCVVIKIENQRYVAEISDVLEVLTNKRGYAEVFKPTV